MPRALPAAHDRVRTRRAFDAIPAIELDNDAVFRPVGVHLFAVDNDIEAGSREVLAQADVEPEAYEFGLAARRLSSLVDQLFEEAAASASMAFRFQFNDVK